MERTGTETIFRQELGLCRRAAQQLAALPAVRVFAGGAGESQGGVLSFVVEGMDCEELGAALGERGIAVRSGLHCAPLAHRTAATLESGTVRASFSAFNTPREADALARAVRGISSGKGLRSN